MFNNAKLAKSTLPVGNKLEDPIQRWFIPISPGPQWSLQILSLIKNPSLHPVQASWPIQVEQL